MADVMDVDAGVPAGGGNSNPSAEDQAAAAAAAAGGPPADGVEEGAIGGGVGEGDEGMYYTGVPKSYLDTNTALLQGLVNKVSDLHGLLGNRGNGNGRGNGKGFGQGKRRFGKKGQQPHGNGNNNGNKQGGGGGGKALGANGGVHKPAGPRCWGCGELGHTKGDCPNKGKKKGAQ